MPTAEPAPSVLIVILNYREPEATIAAVESVLAMDYPKFSVLVIENGSGDNSAEKLEVLDGDRVEVQALDVNLGFMAGVNIGFRRALERGDEFVWMLNNDALVPPGTLSSLVRVAESGPRIGLVSPLIATLDGPRRITFAGGVVSLKLALYDETADLAEAAEWRRKYPGAELVVGTAMLVRTAMIREIGLLDERFFMYYDDMDYCARAQAAGYGIVVDERSTIYHHEKNKNTNPLEMKPHFWYYNAKNALRFWRKHLRLLGSLRPMWLELNRYLRYRNTVLRNSPADQAILAGIWHGLLDRGGPWDAGFRMPGAVKAVVDAYSRRKALQPK